MGETPETAINLQPPIIQISVGSKALGPWGHYVSSTLYSTLKVLGETPLFNLGIRGVWHLTAPGGHARAFVRTRLCEPATHQLGGLTAEGDPFVGVKFLIPMPGAMLTLVIEPLFVDDELLFVESNTQYQGPLQPSEVEPAIGRAESFLKADVVRYLEEYGDGEST
jgi:hypothetical protein